MAVDRSDEVDTVDGSQNVEEAEEGGEDEPLRQSKGPTSTERSELIVRCPNKWYPKWQKRQATSATDARKLRGK